MFMDDVHQGVGHFLQYSENLNVNSPPFHMGRGGGQMTDALNNGLPLHVSVTMGDWYYNNSNKIILTL